MYDVTKGFNLPPEACSHTHSRTPNTRTVHTTQALLRFAPFRLRSLQDDPELYVAVLDWQPHQRLKEAIYLRGPVSKGVCVFVLGGIGIGIGLDGMGLD